MNNASLIRQIQQLVSHFPARLIAQVCLQLEVASDWSQVPTKIDSLMPSSETRQIIARALEEARLAGRPPSEFAFALRAALAVEEQHRHAAQTELVWTGPAPSRLALRRIDEALLQLVSSARHTLTLMSFAVYPVERLSVVIEEAVRRGVAVRFILEMDTNKVNAPTFASINSLAAAHVYTWADEFRSRTAANRYGTLHAKAAVADSQCALISSANLTEHAMTLNMELGLLITGGDLPGKLELLLDDFIERGVFVTIP